MEVSETPGGAPRKRSRKRQKDHVRAEAAAKALAAAAAFAHEPVASSAQQLRSQLYGLVNDAERGSPRSALKG